MATSFSATPVPNYGQPDFDIPENQKDKDWFIQNVRYLSRFYNVNKNILVQDDKRGNINPVQRGLNYYLYYNGQQQNLDYAFMTKDLSNVTLPAVWIPGKKVKSLIDFMLGSLRSQMDEKVIGVQALSKRAVSKKTELYDSVMMKYDSQFKKLFEEVKELGIDFAPEGEQVFDSQKEAKEWLDYNYKDSLEVYAEWMAKYIEECNDSDTLYKQVALDYCAANYCAIYNYIENGKVKQKQIPFYNLIWDSNDTDPFNRNGRYVGFRELLTPQEVFAKCPKLTEAEREEIKTFSQGDDILWNDVMTFYNTPNLNWWTNYPNGQRMVSVVTMFWIGQRDLRFEQSKDKFGNIHYSKIRKAKSGEYWTGDLYTCTLIGNKYATDWGLADNVVRSPQNKSNPELPIKVYSGNTILGDGVSPIGLIAQAQDRIDLYRFKVIEMVGRDAGKGYFINGSKLGEGVTGKQILTDLKTIGVHVTNSSGEVDDDTNRQRLVEVVDMTLDPNIKYYLDLIRQEEAWMEQALSISPIAMGQVQPQLGKAVQEYAAVSSTQGLTLFFKDMMYFNQLNLQYACNLAKMNYTDSEEAAMVIGDRGVYAMKISKEMRFEDLLLFLRVKDTIGQQDKIRYATIMQAMAQNNQVDFLDVLRVDMNDSKTALFKEIEGAFNKKKQEQAQAAQIEFERKMALQKQQLDAMGSQEILRQASEDERAAQRNDSANFKTLMTAEMSSQNPEM